MQALAGLPAEGPLCDHHEPTVLLDLNGRCVVVGGQRQRHWRAPITWHPAGGRGLSGDCAAPRPRVTQTRQP